MDEDPHFSAQLLNGIHDLKPSVTTGATKKKRDDRSPAIFSAQLLNHRESAEAVRQIHPESSEPQNRTNLLDCAQLRGGMRMGSMGK